MDKLGSTLYPVIQVVMTSDFENQRTYPSTFTFPDRWKFFGVYTVYFAVIVGGFVLAATIHQLDFRLLCVLSVMLVFLVAVAGVFALASAEVVIGSNGISRHLLGYTCQEIRWTDVISIREERVANSRVSVTVIRINAKLGRVWGFNAATSMVVSDRCANFEELIDLVNERVAAHNILVEVKSENAWVREPKLRYTIEERSIFL